MKSNHINNERQKREKQRKAHMNQQESEWSTNNQIYKNCTEVVHVVDPCIMIKGGSM